MSEDKLARPTVAIIGTCDTKLEALLYLKQTIASINQCNVLLVDIGSKDPESSNEIDFSRQEVMSDVLASHDTRPSTSRAEALEMMTLGLTRLLSHLHGQARLNGVIGAGGSGNTAVCASAFRQALPIGFPKVMVSTMASGNVTSYVGESDITMMYSVVDVAGMNGILELILGNAARAIVGMVAWPPILKNTASRPAVALTMFGVTTPCVNAAATLLNEEGYDSVIFHATGAGGLALERLITEGKFVGVLDLTTTELADELVGGVLSAGPHRLEAAARMGIPNVVSLGALDMANFGPRSTVPEKFEGRLFHEHNSSVTLMRTTEQECEKLGLILAMKLNAGPVDSTRLLIPLRGISLLDVEDAPFRDVNADQRLFQSLTKRVKCPVIEIDADINNAVFSQEAVRVLINLIEHAV